MNINFKNNKEFRRQFWYDMIRESHYNVNTMAEACGISLRQLERYFAKEFNLSPHEWLTQQRMIAARYLICQENTIKEVAFKLSYKQSSHFCREFKKCYGITPSEYNNIAKTFPNSLYE